MAHRSQGTIYVRVVVGGGAIIVVAHNLYHLLMQLFLLPFFFSLLRNASLSSPWEASEL